MTDGPTGSTVPRRQLGRHLRDLRNQARLTVKAAANALEWSEAKIWRIETGRTSLRSLDVEAMCRAYGAPHKLAQSLMGLAKETKARGWWHSYGDVIPETFDLYIGLEESASQLSWYSSELVPGLLQTEDYARAVVRGVGRGWSDEEVERRVRVRMGRQVLLTRVTAPPIMKMVINEAVLRCAVGGAAVMAAQLERLMEAGDYPSVSIRVVPFEVGLHPGLQSGSFILMRFPTTADGREMEPTTVYMDGFTGALYLDKPHEVARYDAAFDAIWTVAHSEARSMSLLHEIAREFKQ
ncbi:MAG: helix-turn-helix domain-containing protein [Actinoallomurus sp.]